MKISAVYKITNTVTGDFYIGSSKNVKQRWVAHKSPSRWKQCPNNPLYQDMQKYGTNKFEFQVIAEVEADSLKETEQEFIQKLQPTYNNYYAKGRDIEKRKEYEKEYRKTDKYKEYEKEYRKTDKRKEYNKEYRKSDKGKESHRKSNKQYQNQLCLYNGETITLNALRQRLKRKGISNPTAEAKKYLLQ